MKRLTFALVAAATIGGAAGVQASDCCSNDCCFWDPCCGSFEIGAEVLYMRPSACDLDYVIKDNRSSNSAAFFQNQTATSFVLPYGKEHCVKPDYSWGFRVFVGYVMGDCSYDIRAMYTGLHTRDTATTRPSSDGLLWPTTGSPAVYFNGNTVNSPFALTNAPRDTTGTLQTTGVIDTYAKARAKFDWDAVDVTVGSRKISGACCNLWTRMYAGLHYFHLDHKYDVHYQGNIVPSAATAPFAQTFTSDIKDHGRVWAIGPKFGLEARYDLWCGFGLGGQFSAAIIAGQANGSYRQTATRTVNAATPVVFTYNGGLKADSCRNHTVVIPVLDTRLGVNYTWCCNDCFVFIAELGYEFVSYINAVSRLTFNDARGTSSNNCQSYNVDGLYLSLMLQL